MQSPCRTGYTLVAPSKEGPTGPKGETGATGPEGKVGLSLLSFEEQETLKALLPCLHFTTLNGRPDVEITGCNLQVVNGLGKTVSSNGVGNIIIGDDEHESEEKQEGSHITSFLAPFQDWGNSGNIMGVWFKKAVNRAGNSAVVFGEHNDAESGAILAGNGNETHGGSVVVGGFSLTG